MLAHLKMLRVMFFLTDLYVKCYVFSLVSIWFVIAMYLRFLLASNWLKVNDGKH